MRGEETFGSMRPRRNTIAIARTDSLLSELAAKQDGLEDPANSEFLAQLYQALLIGAMEASNAIVPAVSPLLPLEFSSSFMSPPDKSGSAASVIRFMLDT